MAYRGVGQQHPDCWRTRLLGHALGMTPSAASWTALRHRTGLSHHVDAQVRAGSSDGQIALATFVQHDDLDAGLKALLTATRRFA